MGDVGGTNAHTTEVVCWSVVVGAEAETPICVALLY